MALGKSLSLWVFPSGKWGNNPHLLTYRDIMQINNLMLLSSLKIQSARYH